MKKSGPSLPSCSAGLASGSPKMGVGRSQSASLSRSRTCFFRRCRGHDPEADKTRFTANYSQEKRGSRQARCPSVAHVVRLICRRLGRSALRGVWWVLDGKSGPYFELRPTKQTIPVSELAPPPVSESVETGFLLIERLAHWACFSLLFWSAWPERGNPMPRRYTVRNPPGASKSAPLRS